MDDLDLKFLSARYGRDFDAAELVVGGANRTYRLGAGADHVYLRLYRPVGRSLAEIAFELDLLRQCRPSPGIGVARPIATSDGADLVSLSFEGAARYGCLFTALEGRPLTHAPSDMKRLGASTAKLHAALSGISGGEARPLEPSALCRGAVEALRAIPGSAPTRDAIEAWCARSFGVAARPPLPSGNCHGDVWARNAVVQGHGQEQGHGQGQGQEHGIGFFDFDDCGHGPYLIDLGTAAWHLMARDGSVAQAAMAALVAGYEGVRPLEEAERRGLLDFVRLAEVRSLRFLAAYCQLDPQLWQSVLARAHVLIAREGPL